MLRVNDGKLLDKAKKNFDDHVGKTLIIKPQNKVKRKILSVTEVKPDKEAFDACALKFEVQTNKETLRVSSWMGIADEENMVIEVVNPITSNNNYTIFKTKEFENVQKKFSRRFEFSN